jgi:hypothetical protein
MFLARGQYRIEKRPTVLAAMQAAREIEQDRRRIRAARSFTPSRPMVTPRC